MIDIEKAKNVFLKYVDNFDLNETNISRKRYHTLRVMDLSKKIAESLNLNEDQVNLATLIGLLHDIGRFEQWRQYKTYVDMKSIDHGDLGVKILKRDNFLREFIDDDEYDEIIYKALENHNKYKIEDGLDETTLLHSKIIRDADKLDIIYESAEMFWDSEDEKEKIENGDPIAEEYFDELKNHKQIELKANIPSTKITSIFLKLAMVFDLNFDFSLKYMYEKNYINQIVDRFNYKKTETKMQIEEARKIVNDYLLNYAS